MKCWGFNPYKRSYVNSVSSVLGDHSFFSQFNDTCNANFYHYGIQRGDKNMANGKDAEIVA